MDGDMELSDYSRFQHIRPEDEEKIAVPKTLVQKLGSLLAQWKEYIPEDDMKGPSLGVSIRKNQPE